MSRNLLIFLLLIVFACYGASILCLGPPPQPDTSVPEVNNTKPVNLSIVSHGVQVIPQNETALIEKIEQYAAEDYKYFVARDGTNVTRCKLEGTVITLRYNTPLILTWIIELDATRSEEQVLVDTLTVTLPDQPDSRRDLHTCIIVDGPGFRKGMITLDLPPEHEAELRALAGLPQRLKE